MTFCVFVRGISVGTPTPAAELGYLDFGGICTLPYTWIFDVRIKRTESKVYQAPEFIEIMYFHFNETTNDLKCTIYT